MQGAMNAGRRGQSAVGRDTVSNASTCHLMKPLAEPGHPPSQSSLCVVYGDPHVRSFDGQFQTCRVLGTWPLVDNEHLTVQITNAHMGWGNGTAVSKVKFICRAHMPRPLLGWSKLQRNGLT